VIGPFWCRLGRAEAFLTPQSPFTGIKGFDCLLGMLGRYISMPHFAMIDGFF
jgi:hypothetical protein